MTLVKNLGPSFAFTLLLLLSFSLFATGVQAKNYTIADLPNCGLSCLLQTVPAAGCSLTDTACQCQSKTLARTTATCILKNCSMADSLQTSKVQASLCQLPDPSRTHGLLLVSSIAFGIAIFCVILRLIAKMRSKAFYVDDVLIIGVILLSIVPFYCVVAMANAGFGRHLWGLQPGQLTRILRYFYIAENVYIIVLCLIKMSLVWFCLRIFPYKSFKFPAYATLGFIAISSVTVLIFTILSCRPIQLFWNRDIKHGSCFDVNALAYANAGLAISQDLVILILPITMLPRLNMRLRKKVSVGIMFAIGSFGCITSIIRLRSLLSFGNSIDPSWDYVPATKWTVLELTAGAACACLPSIRKLLAPIFPSLIKSQPENSDRTPSAESSGNESKEAKKPQREYRSWDLISEDDETACVGSQQEDHRAVLGRAEEGSLTRDSSNATQVDVHGMAHDDTISPQYTNDGSIAPLDVHGNWIALEDSPRGSRHPRSTFTNEDGMTFLRDPSSASSLRSTSRG